MNQEKPEGRNFLKTIAILGLAASSCGSSADIPTIPPGYCLAIQDGRWVGYQRNRDGTLAKECTESVPAIDAIREANKK